MTIQFYIYHTTAYGEEMQINVVVADDDGTRHIASKGMSTDDGRLWSCIIDGVDSKDTPRIDYFFTVNSAGREREREWTGITHRLDLSCKRSETVSVSCKWHGMPADAQLYSSAYSGCLRQRKATPLPRTVFVRPLRLIARSTEVQPDERLAIVMRDPDTGEYDTAKATAMTEHNTCEWQADINMSALDTEATFKFAIINADGSTLLEEGDCRHITQTDSQPGEAIVDELESPRFNRGQPSPRTIATSIAWLRTADSFGIGDFGDLDAFIQQTAAHGNADIVCVPPVNDTISTHTNADATPYSCISVFAIHPLLCDLRQLPPIADTAEREQMELTRQQLNSMPQYDYLATLKAKLHYLHCIHQQEGDHTMHSASFRRFFAANEHWLVPYAQYSYLRDAYAIADFRQWPNHTEWTEAERGQLKNPRTKAYKKLSFIYYVQYVLHYQLRNVHDKARQLGIVLAGNTTANINPNGCDTWQQRGNVGSDEWWRQRLAAMEAYFDACRVTEAVERRRNVVESTRMLIDPFNGI